MEYDSLEWTANFEAKEEWLMGISFIFLAIFFYAVVIWLNKRFWDTFHPMNDTKEISDPLLQTEIVNP